MWPVIKPTTADPASGVRRVRHTSPLKPPPASPSLHVKDWFISQKPGRFNPNEDTPRNANCGPTVITMLARAFDALEVTRQGADRAIEETRRRIGESQDEHTYTTVGGLIRAARSYGLSAKLQSCFGVAKDLSAIKEELARGRLVIARVQPTYLNPDTTAYHFTVVTKVENGKVTLADPASPNGPITVSAPAFLSAMNRTGMQTLVSVGPDRGSANRR